MPKVTIPPTTLLYPVPAAIISCADQAGKPNLITLAWVGTVCSEPPMLSVSIRPGRFSHPIIEQTQEFVVNLPRADQVRLTDFCGTVSGRTHDKLTEAGFTAVQGSQVKAPLIAECPVNLECKLEQILRLGAHDCFIGRIVACHVNEDCLAGRDLDTSRLDPLAFVAGQYWTLGAQVGHHGFSGGKPG